MLDFVSAALARVFPDTPVKNGTHGGMLRAMALLAERRARPPVQRKRGPVIGTERHRRGGRFVHVPVYYSPPVDRNRYTPALLRRIRRTGESGRALLNKGVLA